MHIHASKSCTYIARHTFLLWQVSSASADGILDAVLHSVLNLSLGLPAESLVHGIHHRLTMCLQVDGAIASRWRCFLSLLHCFLCQLPLSQAFGIRRFGCMQWMQSSAMSQLVP